MSLIPSVREIRRRLPLLGGALVLTQLPALVLFARFGWPGTTAFAAYLVASGAATAGLFAVALALWRRIARIVGLVQGFAESGHLPDVPPPARKGSMESVRASLASLDGLVRSLESEAARDPLTGIYNRRAGLVRLNDDLARARRSSIPLSIVIFDLDELKEINDRWGHATGDEALRRLAHTLHDAVREGDWVARWGGDEFLLGLWGADHAAAAATTGRVLQRLSDCQLEVEGVPVGLGSSVGVAELAPDDDADALFERADEALLAAKRQRRRGATKA